MFSLKKIGYAFFVAIVLIDYAQCNQPLDVKNSVAENSPKKSSEKRSEQDIKHGDDENQDQEDRDEHSKKKSDDPLNDVAPFPFVWIEPAVATLGAVNVQKAPTIAEQPFFTITGYFSPTCAHCGHFFKEELPTIRLKYINPGKIKLGIRPYCHHPVDFLVTRLASSRGPDHFIKFFSLFMENQDVWFEFLIIPSNEKEKRKKVIDEMIKKIPPTIDRNKALVKFNLNETNSMSSVILFALSHGFSIDEIDAVMNATNAEEMENRLIVALMAAKDDKGDPVQAVPTFYINDKYQNHTLNLGDFESLVKTGKITPRPELPTQTKVSTQGASQKMAQAFSPIAP